MIPACGHGDYQYFTEEELDDMEQAMRMGEELNRIADEIEEENQIQRKEFNQYGYGYGDGYGNGKGGN